MLKEGAQTDQQTVPWHWDHDVRIAVAPGIACYEAGKEYEHGGLSPQECVVPVITVSRPIAAIAQAVAITERHLEGAALLGRSERGGAAGMRVDIRAKAGDAATSIVAAPKPVETTARLSLFVEDDDQTGRGGVRGGARRRWNAAGASRRRQWVGDAMELDRLDQLAAEAFEGTSSARTWCASSGASIRCRPTSASSCSAATAPAPTRTRSQEGLEIVERQLRDRTVRAGEEELFKARARERGLGQDHRPHHGPAGRQDRLLPGRRCPACG